MEFTNSTLTLKNAATGSFLHTYGYKTGVMKIADNSAFNVESGSTVELGNVSAANDSHVVIDGTNSSITGIGSYYANEFEDSSLTVSNGATANFKGDIELDSGILSVSGGSTITMDMLSGKNDSKITVDGAGSKLTSMWVQSGYSYYGNPKLNNTSLTFSNGAKVSMGIGGMTFKNGGSINLVGGEKGKENSDPTNDTRATTTAEVNLHGNLELNKSSINVTGGADLDIHFYETGANIAGVEDTVNYINVLGDGSTLHVYLKNGTSTGGDGYFQDVILNVKDNAIFQVEGLEFNFTGGASADEVVNFAVDNGAHALLDEVAVHTADISVTGTKDKHSAFVAEKLTFEDSTFTVSQSYAQVNELLGEAPVTTSSPISSRAMVGPVTGPVMSPVAGPTTGPMMSPMSGPMMSTMMRAAPTPSSDSYLGSLTKSSDLRIAAGGVFVLGDVGTTPPEPETTAKELLLGLRATSAESAGAAGAASGQYSALTQGGTPSYGITLAPKHSAFAVTGGERLTIGAGSSLIIDADAASKIEGGANKYLLDNVPLYIGHDDILLIDNTDNEYNNSPTQDKKVITIANNSLDTAYILAADSKIRVIVDNDTAAEGTFAVIYDENHEDDAAHTTGGHTYIGDIYFTLGDEDHLGDKEKNHFDVCGHVNQGGAGYIDDNRITTKKYDTIIMQNVDFADAEAATIVDNNYALDDSTKYTVYEFKMGIDDYKPNFGVEDELYASLVDVYKAKDSSLQAADDATRFLTKTTVYATEKHDRDAAIKLGSVTEIAVVGGVANMAHDAMTTATDALGRYLDYGINATGAYDEKGSFSLWGIPLYSQSTVDGIEVGSIEGGYEQELIAGIMGVDISNNSGRVGVSFTAGMGESSSTKDFLQTENDTTFYGGGLYGQYKFGSFAVRADLGYYMTEGSLEQESCGYSDFGKVTADVDATIMTAGFDASYLFSFNESWALKPHAGVRYSLYSQDEFTSEVNGNDFFITEDADMSVISVPLGVSLLTNFGIGNWTFQPRLDASIIFNFGDTAVDNNVSTPNLKSFGTANMEADILDEYILSGSLGFDANYGDFTIGLDYNMQQSERRTAHGVFGTIRYEF